MSRLFSIVAFVQCVSGLVMETSSTTDALTVMLAEEKQLRMQLNQQVTDLEKRFESFQAECGCESRRAVSPAFMASLSHDVLHCAGGQTVVFDSVKLNNGQPYNPRHGMFTASINGTYLFTSTLSVEPHHTYHTAFVRNSATNHIGYMYADPSNIWTERSTTIVTHLQAGDEVWMVCLGDSMIDGAKSGGYTNYHSHMSGFLISAD